MCSEFAEKLVYLRKFWCVVLLDQQIRKINGKVQLGGLTIIGQFVESEINT